MRDVAAVRSNAWCEAKSNRASPRRRRPIARPRVGRERVPRHEAALGFPVLPLVKKRARRRSHEGDRRVAGAGDERCERRYRREPSSRSASFASQITTAASRRLMTSASSPSAVAVDRSDSGVDAPGRQVDEWQAISSETLETTKRFTQPLCEAGG